MALLVLASVFLQHIPLHYLLPIALGVFLYAIVRSWFLGRRTTRNRDLHGRTVIITGAFSPLGLTLVTELAQRGAQVIAITPTLSDPAVQSLVDVLRATTRNELIYAEQCDLASPSSIQTFAAQFLRSTGGGVDNEQPRIDAIVFAHEYGHIGVIGGTDLIKSEEQAQREDASRATFFLTTLLLPSLLLAPHDRDIRIINAVNPFYAAAIPSFSKFLSNPKQPLANRSIWQAEGHRSLRSILFSRHLQRVLDALPSKTNPPVPVPQDDIAAVQPKKPAESNIMSISVSPGFSRADIIAPFLRADQTSPYFRLTGFLTYFAILPILHLIAKPCSAAIQSILHSLFLPTPSKLQPDTKSKEDYLRGGSLYADCAVVQLAGNGEQELGGEAIGRAVWEMFEKSLEQWKKEEKGRTEERQKKPINSDSPPSRKKGKEKAA